MTDNSLTTREWEVASRAAQGLTNSRISRQLSITVSTVEQYLTKAYRKLGCKRAGLAAALRETPAPSAPAAQETPDA